ncbi:MAG: hypothetical protein F6K56_16090 [Moorea sp. SIO3G5]|nr:hypothetical protein [Moorena sp. SIO3G5]
MPIPPTGSNSFNEMGSTLDGFNGCSPDSRFPIPVPLLGGVRGGFRFPIPDSRSPPGRG